MKVGTGRMSDIQQIILLILDIVQFLVFAHIILSLLISFQVLNIRQPIVAGIWQGLERLFEPIYTPLRKMLPDTRPLDLAPLALLIGIQVVRILVV